MLHWEGPLLPIQKHSGCLCQSSTRWERKAAQRDPTARAKVQYLQALTRLDCTNCTLTERNICAAASERSLAALPLSTDVRPDGRSSTKSPTASTCRALYGRSI